MLTLPQLASRLVPERTVLVLGAGAAVPSGGPSGVQLAHHLGKRLLGDVVSDDLAETASIIEHRLDRTALVKEIRSVLGRITPTGGISALPHLDWPELYTTNFDQLVEGAYKAAGDKIVAVRSNFEYGRPETEEGTPYYKIHGCVTQDDVDGHKAGMIITEADYERFGDYRETLFARLGQALATRDVLIVGHSLRDPHLRKLLQDSARLRTTRGAIGHTFLLVFEEDTDRAAILESRGLEVCFGGVDELVEALLAQADDAGPKGKLDSTAGTLLLPRLEPATIVVSHALRQQSNPMRLFNGGPATYGDISSELTFPRDLETTVVEGIKAGRPVVALLGAGGVGKTTMARRAMAALSREGFECWEHRPQFPLLRVPWRLVEARLREAGKRGVLLVDDCPRFLNVLNSLLDGWRDRDDLALQIITTGNTAEFRPRIKSSVFFRHGDPYVLATLSHGEIERLLTLMKARPNIGDLVEAGFLRLNRNEQVSVLERRCRSDMFVCLKNIFATEGLDSILLREYAGLNAALQDVYRHVAVLEATGAQVHRQLIIRLLGIDGDQVQATLTNLEGVVDEFDIDPTAGLYGWSTRHPVIAQTIARYKYADDEERKALITAAVEAANPSVRLERELLRELCNREFGIGSLADLDEREALLRRVILRAPGERIPRHRLVGLLLERQLFTEAEREIELASSEVGWDPPLARYQVRSTVQRALGTPDIMPEDRRAILLGADRLARRVVRDFPDDKHAYRSWIDVGSELAALTGDASVLEEAYLAMREAFERIQDPDMRRTLSDAYAELRRRSS